MFYGALVFFGWAIGLLGLICGVVMFMDNHDPEDYMPAFFLGVVVILATCAIQDKYGDDAPPPPHQVHHVQTVKTPKVKPLGTQGEYRVAFNENLDSNREPSWEFQKWHNGKWVAISHSTDKAKLVAFAQSYVKDVQAPSKVITIKKEMKPVLSDSTKESSSAIEIN